jgi:hypothetical protein
MKPIKHVFLTALSLAALSVGAWAQTSASTAPSPKKKHKPVAAAPAQPAVTAADIQALKDALAAQQQQIQQLTQQLQQNQQSSQQAQAAAADAASKAAAAQAQAGQDDQAVGQLKGDVADLKTNVTNTAVTVQETQKAVSALDSPVAIRYKGVTLTPGGYAAAEFVRRSRGLAEDVATPLNSLTLPGASQDTESEFFGTGRTSRMSALVQGELKNVKLAGYVEADFLSSGTTSTNNITNSYTLRQRQAFGQAAFNSGWTFTGGQQWSLATETAHGLDNRTEAVPLTIDTAYNAGMTYARQYGLRLTKNFNNKVWFGVSMENSQATVTTHENSDNFLVGEAGSGKAYNNAITTCSSSINSTATTVTTTCTPAASYSFNPSPDIIAKLAIEPGFGHYEVFGLFDRFRDRTFPCVDFTNPICPAGLTAASAVDATNVSRNGGGIGANARWTVFNKRIVFGLHGFGGSGIGRYGTSGLPDASVYGDGSLHLVRTFQGLGTLEWHGKNLDIYTNAGVEYAARTVSFDPYEGAAGTVVGYGAPTFNNSGCYTETTPTTGTGFNPGSLGKCTGDTRAVIEGTAGFWYRFYNGPKGRFQYGMQFSYATRQTWSGVAAPGTSGTPEGLDGMVFTSFRYYLP